MLKCLFKKKKKGQNMNNKMAINTYQSTIKSRQNKINEQAEQKHSQIQKIF